MVDKTVGDNRAQDVQRQRLPWDRACKQNRRTVFIFRALVAASPELRPEASVRQRSEVDDSSQNNEFGALRKRKRRSVEHPAVIHTPKQSRNSLTLSTQRIVEPDCIRLSTVAIRKKLPDACRATLGEYLSGNRIMLELNLYCFQHLSIIWSKESGSRFTAVRVWTLTLL